MRKETKKIKVFCLTMLLSIFMLSMTVLATEPESDIGEVQVPYTVSLVGETEGYVYNGTVIKPEVESVMYNGYVLTENEYSVEYAENDTYVDAGEHTIYITINANESEEPEGEVDAEESEVEPIENKVTIEKNFTIKQASMKNVKVSLSKDKYTYNGKERKPAVQVTLNGAVIAKENYSVSYSDNVEIGTAKVIVTGKGNLEGTISKTYKIVVGTPSISTTPYYNKIKVSWKKITGASGYAVYRSTSENGTYKKIGTVISGSTLSYTNVELTTGKTYYYKVKAYRKVDGEKKYSSYSNIKKQRVQPKKASITDISRASYTSLKIEWKKVSGASGYGIYRSTSENGEYKRVGTVKKGSTLSYTDKGLTCGRTYYYKVRAYRTVSGKNYYGSASAAESKYPRPSKVSWNKISTSYNSSSITLKWKKTSGAKGYQIYRSTSKNGEYTKVKTITSASTVSWKDTGLTKGKTYYYKIRAYCKPDGKTRYGAFSSVFTKTKAGWKYTTYDGKKVKLYYNASGKVVKDVSNLIGKQSSYVIKVNKQKCTVTVYAKDGSNGYIIPVKAFICSPGYSTPVGTFYTPQKYRWHELMGPCWGQWCTRIYKGVLFHSVYYNSYNNNNTLSVSAYNKLGTICSHGCVRLTAGDAKWIYDNCKLSTKVIIYNSSNAGPLGKPTAHKLSSGHTWDPTDPNMKSKCKSRGCH